MAIQHLHKRQCVSAEALTSTYLWIIECKTVNQSIQLVANGIVNFVLTNVAMYSVAMVTIVKMEHFIVASYYF